MTGRVLFVDDEEMVRKSASQWLRLAEFEVDAYTGASDVLQHINTDFEGVVVTDVKMPGTDGLALMEEVHQRDREIPVILVTGHGDISMAVKAMHDGAYDFIEKPSTSEKLIETVRRAVEKRRLVLENRALRQVLQDKDSLEARLMGNGAGMAALRRQLAELAVTNVNVMINGETGSGKGVVARCVHDLSPRREQTFVSINCGAIPEAIFESELFGHEGGAFTGAAKQRIGRFEYANGGTVFLDEVESMPLEAQVKLLQAIEERQIQRLGSNELIPIDVRFVAASKVDLAAEAGKGRFRSDLYYRLNVAELHIPPLRQRREDILLLFDYFSAEAARIHGCDVPPSSSADQGALLSHQWPGNVRELKNIAERYVLQLSYHTGGTGDLLNPGTSSTVPTGEEGGLTGQVDAFERSLIHCALDRHEGNIAAVTKELRIPRRTLNKKMQKYQLCRQSFLKRGA